MTESEYLLILSAIEPKSKNTVDVGEWVVKCCQQCVASLTSLAHPSLE